MHTMAHVLNALNAGRQTLGTLSRNKVRAEDPSACRVEAQLQTSRVLGGQAVSTTVASLKRADAPFLFQEAAAAQTLAQGAETLGTIYQELNLGLGKVGEEGQTLAGRLGKFLSTLSSPVEAPSTPIFFERLLNQAADLSREFQRLSQLIQGLRSQADQQIGQSVHTLNGLLEEYSELNHAIGSWKADDPQTFSLLDRRDDLFMEISKFMDVNETANCPPHVSESNVNYLWTAEGRALVTPDHANTLSFNTSPNIGPEDVFGQGRLNDISLHFDNLTFALSPVLQKGSLGALFEARDTLLPHFQTTLDEAAFVLAQAVNSIHNQGSAYAAPEELTSNATLEGTLDLTPYTGTLRLALTNKQGNIVEHTDIDLSTTGTLADLITKVNAALTKGQMALSGGTLTFKSTDPTLGVALRGIGGNCDELLSKLSLNNLFTSTLSDWLTQTGSAPQGLAMNLTVNSRLVQNPRQVAHGLLSDKSTLSAGDTGLQASDTQNLQALSTKTQQPLAFSDAGFWDSTEATLFDYMRGWLGDIANRADNARRIADDRGQVYSTSYESLLSARGIDPLQADVQQAKMEQYVESLMLLYAKQMRLAHSLLDILKSI